MQRAAWLDCARCSGFLRLWVTGFYGSRSRGVVTRFRLRLTCSIGDERARLCGLELR